MKNIILKYVLPILTCVLAVVATVLGSVAVAKAYREPKILSAYEIGLADFLQGEATKLSVSSPSFQGEIKFTDEEAVSEAQNAISEVVRNAPLRKTGEPKHSACAGYVGVTFTVNGNKYSFSVVEDRKLYIGVKGEWGYYNSECCIRLISAINEIANKAEIKYKEQYS